ncbi:MAG: rhomboid family intramembrane serine protease [Spirochaetes bacterium]|jgi:membrane associated rhomboid family serine protease|nr:rhomboid family intramembrane serine protease [Spirochaetota bacterium]
MNKSASLYNGWVLKLIIINVLVFIIQVFVQQYQVIYTLNGFNGTSSIADFYLGLIPALVTEKGYIWQIFSYMFLHSSTSFIHIFFNMYAVLIFGVPIEQEWGSRRFLLYYLICGTGAGIAIYLINLISGNIGYYVPTIGASGAVFGLLLAFGLLFPDAELLLFFILPIKAKYLVILYGGIELYLELFGGETSISHIGHLGGLVSGIIFFIILKKPNLKFKSKLFKAKIEKKINLNPTQNELRLKKMDPGSRETRLEILKKIRSDGFTSLSDDEIQFIKYLDIMSDKSDYDNLCSEDDLDLNDSYCNNCENYNSCFLREVKKHFKN